jgi:hypothetical protein
VIRGACERSAGSKKAVVCGQGSALLSSSYPAASRNPDVPHLPPVVVGCRCLDCGPRITSCLLCRSERCPVFIFPSSGPRLDPAHRPFLELCLHELFTRTVLSDTILPAATCLTSLSSSQRPMGGSTSSRGVCSSTTSLSSQSLAKPSRP